MTTNNMSEGHELNLTIERMAHGGEGLTHVPVDGRVLFAAGGFPGDEVRVRLTQVKKNFMRGEVIEVLTAGPHRVPSSCPAAAAGAGCCDFAELAPASELDIKADILTSQLRALARVMELPELERINLEPARGWRTRVRLGVGPDGRAGLRKRGSHELVTDQVCTQLAPGLVEGLVGESAQKFTPGAEVIAVMDGDGNRHVIESRKGSRGKRVERIDRVVEGGKNAVEHVEGVTFTFPATAFWQAHTVAPETYSALVRGWLRPVEPRSAAAASSDSEAAAAASVVAWDLYGGVGAFVPAITGALGQAGGVAPTIYSVDYSPAASAAEQEGLSGIDVKVITDKVENVAATLPRPRAVVLDPPRTGAGADVVAAVAGAGPAQVVHIGCDPATFARDLAAWVSHGYSLQRLAVINAFPGTHHFETVALLKPATT